MAKRSRENGPNKSQVIRDYKKDNPKSKPKEIAEKLNEQHQLGITAAYVSTILSSAKRKKRGGARKVASATTAAPAAKTGKAAKSNDKVSLDSLVRARKLAEALGGVESAKMLLDALAKLTG